MESIRADAKSAEAARMLFALYLTYRICAHGKRKTECKECGGSRCILSYSNLSSASACMASERLYAENVSEAGVSFRH